MRDSASAAFWCVCKQCRSAFCIDVGAFPQHFAASLDRCHHVTLQRTDAAISIKMAANADQFGGVAGVSPATQSLDIQL